jgi:hypothetical protein
MKKNENQYWKWNEKAMKKRKRDSEEVGGSWNIPSSNKHREGSEYGQITRRTERPGGDIGEGG